MASTSTSHSIRIILNDIDNGTSFEVEAHPAVKLHGGIDITQSGVGVEDHAYSLTLKSSQAISARFVNVSLYQGDPIRADLELTHEADADDEFYQYDLTFKEKNKAPSRQVKLFWLTYGMVRIGISIDGFGTFLTRDIPCGCSEAVRSQEVRQMLNLLLDSGDDSVADWMFASDDGVPDRYAILESTMQHGASKSLTSFLRLVQGVLDSYESWTSYFRTNAHCIVTGSEKRLSGYSVRQLGVSEFTWLMRNGDVMTEVQADTGIEFNGRNFFPRYVRTEVKTKSFDNYENRVVLAFLSEMVLGALRSAESVMLRFHESVQVCIDDLESIKGEYELPAMVVMEECARHQLDLIAQIEEMRTRAQRLLITYESILPGVNTNAGTASPPQRTKVFQEVRAYSAIYQQIERWRAFGYFSLARESLALHALRLDKLYEYYCLFRILETLRSAGFDLDDLYREPTINAQYSLENEVWFFKNERTVSSLYRLARSDVKARLYYQPVIYWDGRLENDLTLLRKSPRRAFAPQALNACYTPDYLLVLESEGIRKHYILDAKYRALKSVTIPEDSGWSTFDDSYHKYYADVISTEGKNIDAVWLLVGKEESSIVRYYETAAWVASISGYTRSGVASLSPSADAIADVFDELGVTLHEYESIPADTEPETALDDVLNDTAFGIQEEEAETEDLGDEASITAQVNEMVPDIVVSPAIEMEYLEPSEPLSSTQEPPTAKAKRKRPGGLDEEVLNLCLRLIEVWGDWHDLCDQHWVNQHLKISHPLLRDREPRSKREKRLYELQELGIGPVYLFKRWRPDETARLRRFVELRERDD